MRIHFGKVHDIKDDAAWIHSTCAVGQGLHKRSR